MRTLTAMTIAAFGSGITVVTMVSAQPPSRPDPGRGGGGRSGDVTSYITRMMSFDKNQDGQLSKEEVTDSRLVALFERADANQDGVVTKEELTADFNKESANLGPERSGGGPGGPPGGRGFGRPGGPHGAGGPPGPGGPGMGVGGPPPIGQVLPPPIQGMLRLSNAQKKRIEALQRHVDLKLAEILTDDQKQELEELKRRGPGGPEGDRGAFGPPPGGPGGNRRREGGPGGPPGGDRGRPNGPANDQPDRDE